MGQLPFLNDTSLSHCIWLTCLLPGNRGKAGSCGGMIWYELKLFPNRLHRVWSCPLLVWWILSPTIDQYYITSALFPSCLFVLRSKMHWKTITVVLYLAWLCGWRCPRPYYLWSVEGVCIIVFPCSVVWRWPPEGPASQCHSSSASSRRSLARGRDWRQQEEMTKLFVLHGTEKWLAFVVELGLM